MSFLTDLVNSLPGSNEVNPLTGTSPSQFVESTTTGNLSDNGFNAILALDPTISQQRMLNAGDKAFGGNGNIFSENAMREEAGLFNTVGKIIAASYIGGEAGATTGSQTVGGAVVGGTAAGMNNQSVGEGALAGGIIGAVAPTATTDPATVTETANGASSVSSTQNALNSAGQGATQGAVHAGINAGRNDKSIGDAMVGGAITGAITGGVNSTASPEIAGAISGAVNNAVAADRSGQPIENGLFYGAVTGGAGAAAGNEVYQDTGSKPLAQAAANAAGGAASVLAQNNLPRSANMPNPADDPEFRAYMDARTKSYAPQVSSVINPIILAAAGNGLTVEQTETTQLTQQNGGVSPLLIEGA